MFRKHLTSAFITQVMSFSLLGILLILGPIKANSQPSVISPNELPIEIGNTRVIYNEGMHSASVSIRNNGQIPYLIALQIHTYCENGWDCPSNEDFMVSPVFHIVYPGESYPFRIVRLAEKLSEDIESLYLIQLKILPSQAAVSSKDLNASRVNLAIAGTMKLFWRPRKIVSSHGVLDLRDSVKIYCSNRRLGIENPSVYWGTVAQLTSSGQSLLKNGPLPIIAPRSVQHIEVKRCPREVDVAFITESGRMTALRRIQVYLSRNAAQ